MMQGAKVLMKTEIKDDANGTTI